MAKMPLLFAPPLPNDIVALHIYESPDSDVSHMVEIEVVTNVGVYPSYITQYTTNLASDVEDWFAIKWEDSGGAFSLFSSPIKGGTATLVGEIVERVLLRNPDIDENIVIQEAEGVISYIYHIDDPYTVDIDTVSRLWLTGLTTLTYIACTYDAIIEVSASASQSYTAGILSEQTGTIGVETLQNLRTLEQRTLKRMGIGGSLLGSINKRSSRLIEITQEVSAIDSSRLLSLKAIITNDLLLADIPSGIVISDG